MSNYALFFFRLKKLKKSHQIEESNHNSDKNRKKNNESIAVIMLKCNGVFERTCKVKSILVKIVNLLLRYEKNSIEFHLQLEEFAKCDFYQVLGRYEIPISRAKFISTFNCHANIT